LTATATACGRWAPALRAASQALPSAGRLVSESRDPARTAWLERTRDHTYRHVVIPHIGRVQTWTDLTSLEQDLAIFQMTFLFERDGPVLTSHSTLRFASRTELAAR
jgi:hypothetical protein